MCALVSSTIYGKAWRQTYCQQGGASTAAWAALFAGVAQPRPTHHAGCRCTCTTRTCRHAYNTVVESSSHRGVRHTPNNNTVVRESKVTGSAEPNGVVQALGSHARQEAVLRLQDVPPHSVAALVPTHTRTGQSITRVSPHPSTLHPRRESAPVGATLYLRWRRNRLDSGKDTIRSSHRNKRSAEHTPGHAAAALMLSANAANLHIQAHASHALGQRADSRQAQRCSHVLSGVYERQKPLRGRGLHKAP